MVYDLFYLAAHPLFWDRQRQARLLVKKDDLHCLSSFCAHTTQKPGRRRWRSPFFRFFLWGKRGQPSHAQTRAHYGGILCTSSVHTDSGSAWEQTQLFSGRSSLCLTAGRVEFIAHVFLQPHFPAECITRRRKSPVQSVALSRAKCVLCCRVATPCIIISPLAHRFDQRCEESHEACLLDQNDRAIT